MNTIRENLERVRQELPEEVKLVAISKFHPSDQIRMAYNCGQRCFGESRAQELATKAAELPADTEWHFIGHLQTNKLKTILPAVSLIHSVDSLNLLREIEKTAAKRNIIVRCLLQIYIAEEETKFGFAPGECRRLLESGIVRSLTHIRICGLMGMATNTDNTEQIRSEFKRLHELFDEIKKQYFQNDPDFTELSMGMSDDYAIAIEEGATMVRIGSRIFGERNY